MPEILSYHHADAGPDGKLKVLALLHLLFGLTFGFGPIAGMVCLIQWTETHVQGLYSMQQPVFDPLVDWNRPIAGIVFGTSLAGIALLVSSGQLTQRKNRWFSIITGMLAGLIVPLGTVLAIFTVRTLRQPDVIAAYADHLFEPSRKARRKRYGQKWRI